MTSACIEQTLILVLVEEEVEVRLLLRTLQTCGLPTQENIHTQTSTHRQGTSDTTGQLVVGIAVGGG